MFEINGIVWDVVYVDPYDPTLYRGDGSLTWGMCDKNERLIYINESLPDYEIKKVLCHEIVHAAMFSYEINLTYEQEELVATLISQYGDEIISITNEIFSHLTMH